MDLLRFCSRDTDSGGQGEAQASVSLPNFLWWFHDSSQTDNHRVNGAELASGAPKGLEEVQSPLEACISQRGGGWGKYAC